MADFNQLVADVYAITNRPDLVAETQMAVKSATLQLHRSDFFYKDINEVALQFDTLDFIQTIQYKSLFPQYRALKYLRKYDPTLATGDTNGIGNFIKVVSPEQVLDSYGAGKTDICYVAGTVIQIKSSTQIQYALIGMYQNPIVATPDTYSSWISDEAYYAIVYSAASKLYGTVLGNATKRDSCAQEAMREFIELQSSNIIAEGY